MIFGNNLNVLMSFPKWAKFLSVATIEIYYKNYQLYTIINTINDKHTKHHNKIVEIIEINVRFL